MDKNKKLMFIGLTPMRLLIENKMLKKIKKKSYASVVFIYSRKIDEHHTYLVIENKTGWIPY
ncbi:hypothetical protein [Sphingobacterium prati]|uniref:hypothetical protein n=1 Tax=Sphingobacterium prati TaxID=2737006 RepID=UPI001C12DEB7|nr:hypothetical protein [Sphingobacterium prati]